MHVKKMIGIVCPGGKSNILLFLPLDIVIHILYMVISKIDDLQYICA